MCHPECTTHQVTDVEAIKKAIISGSSQYPVCRLINMIGETYESPADEDEANQAKKALIEILSIEDKDIAAVAFCYLVESLKFDSTDSDNEILDACSKFEETEKGTPHLAYANESMQRRGTNKNLSRS